MHSTIFRTYAELFSPTTYSLSAKGAVSYTICSRGVGNWPSSVDKIHCYLDDSSNRTAQTSQIR